MSQTDNSGLLTVSPWDAAPRAVGIIRDIGKARPTLTPKLSRAIQRLQDEFATIRSEDDRIVAKLTRRLRAKYTYHTNAIEGNTLTESETRSFIETGMTISGKPLRDFIEAKNIPQALDMLIHMAGEAKTKLKVSDILDLHRLVVSGIEDVNPGYFRHGFIRIGTSTYVPPPAYEIEHLINEMIEYANRNPDKLTPVEMAFKLHLWCVSIHPFDDGNGRVSRLLAGLILMKHKLPPTIIKKEHKSKYLKVLRQTQYKDKLKPYYDFMAEEYVATLVEYITIARQAGPGDNVVPLAEAAKKYEIDPEYLSLLARSGTIYALKSGGRW
ncbi:MAG TPA: Fic family protein, partial [Nitrososphaerales archaeon]|nr:Fic family protein [Nitrososphaerales archaeon]